jgi:hypothetical protein
MTGERLAIGAWQAVNSKRRQEASELDQVPDLD